MLVNNLANRSPTRGLSKETFSAMNIHILRSFSLAYLLVPNLLFVLGWFRMQLSIPILLCLCYLIFRQVRFTEKNESYCISTADLLILFAAASFWTFCTGMGGLSYQIADYWGHNAKFYDLYKTHGLLTFLKKGSMPATILAITLYRRQFQNCWDIYPSVHCCFGAYSDSGFHLSGSIFYSVNGNH